MLELLVQSLPSLSFLLFQFDFILVTIAVLAFPIACLVELDVGCLAIKLYVLEGAMIREYAHFSTVY